jgi:hypothetical protein
MRHYLFDGPQTPIEQLDSRFAQAWNRPVSSKSLIVGLIAASTIALFTLSVMGR